MHDRLRAWWWHRQGLDGSLWGRACRTALERTGWVRSVGSSTPYLALRARTGASREEAEAAAAETEIQELPSARACTYVAGRCDFPLALRLCQQVRPGDLSTALKLGATPEELDRLGRALVEILDGRELDPREMRDQLGDLVRNFGEDGKKKGLTTTLPVALGRLQAEGAIRRVSVDRRLDHERYRYTAWRPSPFADDETSPEGARREIASRYFKWIGPATMGEFRWFTGFGAGAAAEAVARVDLVDVGEGRLILREDEADFRSFIGPDSEQVALVGGLDGLFLLRRDVASLIAEEDRAWLGEGVLALKPAGALQDLSSHGIVDRGRLIGLWEYDPDSERIAWATFRRATPAVEEAIAATEAFVQTLGDARAFSLDSPNSRRPRIEALDKTRSGGAADPRW